MQTVHPHQRAFKYNPPTKAELANPNLGDLLIGLSCIAITAVLALGWI